MPLSDRPWWPKEFDRIRRNLRGSGETLLNPKDVRAAEKEEACVQGLLSRSFPSSRGEQWVESVYLD